MAPSPHDMRVPAAAAEWIVHALGHRTPDPMTLQELLQCDTGLNNLILRDLKFIWTEMEASFDFIKSKQVLSHFKPCKPNDKKPQFISKLRRYFYTDDSCSIPDAVVLQEVTDAVVAATAAADAASAVAAASTAALLNNSTTNKKKKTSINFKLRASPPPHRRVVPSPPAHTSHHYQQHYQQQLQQLHHPQHGAAMAAAAAAAASSIHGRMNSNNNPWAAAGTSAAAAAAAAAASAGHTCPAAASAAASVPNFYPPHHHHHHHGAPSATATAAGLSHGNNIIPRRRPYSQAFASATSSSAATHHHRFQPPPELEAMLRQFEDSISNINNQIHGAADPNFDSTARPREEGHDEAEEENESRRPQNATEASILAELQAFGFEDAREVLDGIRRLTAKNNNNTPPSMDEVMVDLVTQREELEHAKQVDEARLASEALRKEEARRRRESIAAELKERRLEAPLQEWLQEFFCNSWILSTTSAYEVLDKCMMSTTSTTASTEFRDALFELLDTEKNCRQWYQQLPRAYFNVLVCKRLVEAGENAKTLTKQLMAESATLKTVLCTLSEQTQGGVPRIFLKAHDEFGHSATGSDTENKNDDENDNGDDDDDKVEVLRRVESNAKGTSSSSPSPPRKKVRRSSTSSPIEQKSGGDVIDLC